MDNTYEEKVIEYNYKLQNSKEKWKYVKIDDIKTHYKISNFGKIGEKIIKFRSFLLNKLYFRK